MKKPLIPLTGQVKNDVFALGELMQLKLQNHTFKRKKNKRRTMRYKNVRKKISG